MHRRPFLAALIAGLIAILLIVPGAGCRRGTPPASDRPIESGGAERFVVLSPALGIICDDLGLRERVVGVHAWSPNPPRSAFATGTHDDPDLEAILRVEPTHILVQRLATPVPASLLRLAEREGWIVWDFPLDTLDDIAASMDELDARLHGLGAPTEPDPFDPRSIDPSDRLGAERPSARLADAWRDRDEPARRAGRVLLLAETDPPGAMGPGSFHHQLLERLGATPALSRGGPWQELDHEDILALRPDAIVLFRPRADRDHNADDRAFAGSGAGTPASTDDALAALGGIAGLDVPAVRDRRVLLIDDPLGLMPASSLAGVAEALAQGFERWLDTPDPRARTGATPHPDTNESP